MAPADPGAERTLAAALGLHDVTARLLRNRGLADPEAAARFLYPKLADLHDPGLLKGMDAAVARIRQALVKKERIVVHGDFDADGVTSTALLMRFLRILQAPAVYHIPERLTEGYGVSVEAVERLAAEGAGLMITVDCGITAREPIARARALGLDTVVTDHHEPSGALPEACAIVDPKREDETYPFRDLAGVGVVFKLAWALARDVSVAGAVSDELKAFLWETGENRILVKHGLSALERSRHPGEGALLSVAGTEAPGSQDLAFRLGPRINAAGRLGDSRTVVEMFLTDSREAALESARSLDRMNRRRQEIERKIFDEACERVVREGRERGSAIVLAGEGWHPGVIGVVASKLVETFHRPVVLVSLDGEAGRGSARSVPAFHVHRALSRCADLLTSYGGHAQAAGLTLRSERFEEFRGAFERAAAESLTADDLVPRLAVDAELSLGDVGTSLLAEVSLLRPFGIGNPEPVFAVRGGTVAGRPKTLGSEGRHLSFFFRTGDAARRAVAFGMGGRAGELEGARADLAFVPYLNRFGGRENVELRVKDIRLLT
ncbi:MAG: single-stranded-DNA-specific exonuclease RecJ [Planctomycetes bacterium]|nr:single-stranded-DNA-specific exonuclease RecJ [Planctomycetota bacterium]